MFVSTVFARFGRRNRLFVQNATKREKKRDWLAERIGFELVVAFLRTIAVYWPAKRVFRQSAANRDYQTEESSRLRGTGSSLLWGRRQALIVRWLVGLVTKGSH